MSARYRQSALFATLIMAFCFANAVLSQTPQMLGRVTDLAAVLSAEESRQLVGILATYERETTHQIAVLTVASLSGESIESFSRRVATAWGLGRKHIDNGILVVLVPAERKVRIELGSGFERYISNAQAGEIIRSHMTPEFRNSQYGKGLERGIQELMRQGRAFVPPQSPKLAAMNETANPALNRASWHRASLWSASTRLAG